MMDYSTLDDIELLAHLSRLSHQDRNEIDQLLGVLYDRFGRLIFSIACHMVGDETTAEEITQDVFVKIFDASASYRPELSKVSSWMVTITRRRAIDEIRRRKIRVELDGVEWTEENESSPLFDLVHDGNLEEEVDGHLEDEQLRKALTSLPSDQRKALRLAYFSGLNQQEIADLLHEPIGTIKSRIRAGMNKLREALQEH